MRVNNYRTARHAAQGNRSPCTARRARHIVSVERRPES
ncbi:hypothetical protein CFter6_5347 [Collimonas fungivorans]|uniref:Uncharacterized protein n=1 Tax=Collimonas fungivorans TaxID=158899 RepID=A0A127PJW2_9BURK|nr:hypothetical protein CFter6_5347 [Collimonas fungivorans]